jgi:hypothetical protein
VNVTELVTAVRISGALPTADPTYTDARVREELGNALTTIFERPIVNSREGYWRKTRDTTIATGQSRYRLPPRAVAGTAETIEVFSGAQAPLPADRRSPGYTFQGDQIVFNAPPDAGLTLRVHYYLRPSALYALQLNVGRVTEVHDTTKEVVVTSLPLNLVTGLAIATADKVDIIHPNGWHEACVVDEPSTIAGTTLTFGPTVDLSMVEVGDYVRAAGQTDWPALPEDFHRTLVDAAAMSILVSKGDLAKAQVYAAKVGADLERFTDLLQPRVKDHPPATIPRAGILRGRSRWGGGGW